MSASFWLDNSLDSIFFAPSNGLSSRSSTDSFNIDNIAALDNYPSLLLSSHSLDSLPLCDIELIKAPPCPSSTLRRKRSQHTFLSLMASLAVPKGNHPNKKYANVLVSSPTPQRLKNIPRLKPALRTWISGVPRSNPPDMAPWSPPREKPHYIWVPEGSCFPPSYLKRYLRGRYGPVATHPPSTLSGSRLVATSKLIERTESPSRPRPLRRCASHCTPHPRVPDCTPAYIPLSFPPVHTHGRPRRWSLSVPPSYLGTEIITRRLESQRIDAIKGAESAQSDASNDDPSLPLPAIKISTSTATIAISFPGSPSPERPTPPAEPLAIRRGQKMLAPLKVRSAQRVAEEYPGIPTAFLGTPSAYSPHFHLTSSTAQVNAKSIPIGDMISTLRSQAASLKVVSPVEDCAPLLDIPPSSANSLSASSSDIAPSISEDDWAFAQDLMSRYGDRPQDKTLNKARHRQQQVPSARKSHVPRPRSATTSRVQRASVPAASSTPNNRPNSSSAPRTDLIKPRHSTGITRQRKDYIGTTKYVSHPDSTTPGPPLRLSSPVTPNHSRALPLESTNNSRGERSTKHPPGILKRVKSVRFADMPKPEDAGDIAPSERQPSTSISKDVGGSPPLQPSPLRTCFMPEELEVQTPSRQPPTPTTEESSQVFTVDGRGSVQLAPSQTVNLHSPMFNPPSLPATPWMSDKSSLSGSHGSRAPKRLSLLIREHYKDKEKENSPLALRAQRRARRHTEVDENASRRAPASRGSRKHRLSSPLKSFLERLRA
ncbi:hypothetical protein F5888DRAFT_1908765 [Russula emetica]|nr:hypothetical protein F5888DRAFT_1908765 [Russula emetica]